MSDIEEVSDDQLFNEAIGEVEIPETPEAVVEPEQVEDEGTQAAEAEPVAEAAPVEDAAAQVPSWRVREINEEKRALADRVAALESERAQWQRQQEQQQPPKVEQPKEAKPDPLLDPEGFEKYIEQKLETRLLNNDREADLQRAHERNPEIFDKAYAEAQQALKRGNPELLALMNNTRRPGDVLINWYKSEITKREVGNDPDAYFAKRLEALKADPAKWAEIAGRPAPQAQASGSRPNVSLPPSLTGASRSNASLRASDGDVADDELFRQIAG